MTFSIRICFFSFCILLISVTNAICQESTKTNKKIEAKEKDSRKKIALIAGPITGHGKHTHEYEKSVILIKHLFETSPNMKELDLQVHFGGWPEDPKALNDVDSIILISDGGDHNEKNHPLYIEDRLEQLEKHLARGCGFAQIHWSTFHPARFHDRITEMMGGYFDYETGPAANKWYSAIKHYTETSNLASPSHPISRGVKPFKTREEYYYRMRFNKDDSRITPIIKSRPPGEKEAFTVGWAVQRKNGGRSFGFTGGHYYDNWWNADFRKLLLNAIAWTAKAEIPHKGVETILDPPIKALIVTGHNHAAHDWRAVTAALIQTIELDPRVFVDVTEDPEFLAKKELHQYDTIILNYCNWERVGLTDKAKQNFVEYLKKGGGLSIIHFANGAFNFTLPNKQSDWEEYRTRIVRRVWIHGKNRSNHDPFGNFKVELTNKEHEITDGLVPFITRDELYFGQEGPLPIEPLLQARSKVTGDLEPLAWVYNYENGRVFQTLLGHAEPSIRLAGHVIRRGTVWSSRNKNISFDPPVADFTNYIWRSGAQWTPAESKKRAQLKLDTKSLDQVRPPNTDPLADGKFDKAFNANNGGVFALGRKDYKSSPITVDCWVKIATKNGFQIIAASETKASPNHWEMYSYNGTGAFSVYMPGRVGAIDSGIDICDNAWHYVGMVFEPNQIRLYVDGKLAKTTKLPGKNIDPTHEAFAIGSLVEQTLGCNGLIDDFRIRSGAHELTELPTKAATTSDDTIALWSFDQFDKEAGFADQSNHQNNAFAVVTKIQPSKTDSRPNDKANPNKQSNSQQKPDKTPEKKSKQQKQTAQQKVTGHWGEDALGFRWTEDDSVDGRWRKTNIGPFLAATFPIPGGYAEKGLAIRLGKAQNATVLYDTKTATMSAAWLGKFVDIHPARYGLIRHIKPGGAILFHNNKNAAWPDSKVKYNGLKQFQNQIELRYSVNDQSVIETPSFFEFNVSDQKYFAFKRTFELPENFSAKELRLLTHPRSSKTMSIDTTTNGNVEYVKATIGGKPALVFFHGDEDHSDKNHILSHKENHISLNLALIDSPSRIQITIVGSHNTNAIAEKSIAKIASETKLHSVSKKVAAIWNTQPTTTFTKSPTPKPNQFSGVNSLKNSYVIDTINLPFKNEYNALMFISGHDFLPNGDIAACTVHGDVWIAKGVGKNKDQVQWKRFATGLYQPLGLKIIDEKIHVLGRDQITRLHDQNGDGEADYYENFSNLQQTSSGVHDYSTCLETDQNGNLYFINANQGLIRVSPDGQKQRPVATGFRNPHGMGVSPSGIITAAPQEGEWTPNSAICKVHDGFYFGFGGPKITETRPLGYDQPMCWLPRLVDNSSGGQVWVKSDRWGPLEDQMIHLSFGKCRMFLAVGEAIDSKKLGRKIEQGGVTTFPLEFESGASRGRFSPHDGQLYVSGLLGWVSSAGKDGCLQRVRYVGNPVNMVTGIEAKANGILLRFSQPIDKSAAQDPDNFTVQHWNYRYASTYGSADYKISDPNQIGRDDLHVKSTTLQSDGRSIFLEMPEIQTVMQMSIEFDLISSVGLPFSNTIYNTINVLPSEKIEPGAHSKIARKDRLTSEQIKNLKQGVSITITSDPELNSTQKTQTSIAKASLLTSKSNPFGSLGSFSSANFKNKSKTKITGHIKLPSKDRYQFRLLGVPNASLKIQDSSGKLIAGSYEATFEPMRLKRGYNRFTLEFPNLGEEIHFQLQWKSSSFNWESVPPNLLFHEAKNPSTPDQLIHGASLYANFHCGKCHDSPANRFDTSAPNLAHTVATKRWIADWILNPAKFRDTPHMPAFLNPESKADQKIASEIAAFLSSQQKTVQFAKTKSTKEDHATIDLSNGEKLFEQLGCIGCHHFEKPNPNEEFNRISLHYANAKYSPANLIQFLKNPHHASPESRMPNFNLSDTELKQLAEYLLERSAGKLKAELVSQEKASKENGKAHFDRLGCASCHQTSVSKLSPPSIPFPKSNSANSSNSCINSTERNRSKKQPAFSPFSKSDKTAINKYINFINANNKKPLTIHRWQASNTLAKKYRCTTCHQQNEIAATLPEIIDAEGTLGFAAEQLPDLTFAAEKLKANWSADFISTKNHAAMRPWLKARMPTFPKRIAEQIVYGWADQHGYFTTHKTDRRIEAYPTSQLVQAGKDLITQSKGHDCRQCHAVGKLPATGDAKTQIALGVNFSHSKERLSRDYYNRWMHNPLRIDPMTKMPKYTTDSGRNTKLDSIFKGDAQLQFEAIWRYLQSIE